MKTHFKAPLLALALACTPSLGHADALGVKAGFGSWNADYDGNIGSLGTDLKQLGYSEKKQNFAYVALEHPIPVIPNVLLQHTQLKSNAIGTGTLNIDGNTVSGNIASELDLTHTDATFYYEVLDNWINLDLGLTARKFDASMSAIDDGSNLAYAEADEIIPMLYGMAQVDLPLTGLSFGGSANVIDIKDNKVMDMTANLRYTSDTFLGLGIELGYRQMSVQFEDSGKLNTDFDVKGPYLSLQINI